MKKSLILAAVAALLAGTMPSMAQSRHYDHGPRHERVDRHHHRPHFKPHHRHHISPREARRIERARQARWERAHRHERRHHRDGRQPMIVFRP